MQQPAGWHRADIIAAVHKRGTTLAALGRRHGYANSTLRSALIKPTTPANTLIADFLGVPPHTLWPAWFDESGRRIPSARKDARGARRASSRIRKPV